MLIEAGVTERALYGGAEWSEFVRNLRVGDEALVADLRIFRSRKALGRAAAEIEARKATLVTAVTQVRIDPPTIRESHEAERKWAGERSIGGRKRAKGLSAKALAARRAKIKASRMPDEQAVLLWRDLTAYPSRDAAAAAMGPGWNKMKAWRAFGPREPVQ